MSVTETNDQTPWRPLEPGEDPCEGDVPHTVLAIEWLPATPPPPPSKEDVG